MRDGKLILDSPMAEVGRRFIQLVVKPELAAEAAAYRPVFDETHFGRRVMVFDSVDSSRLAAFGEVGTPTLSDLFVALMQPPPEAAAGAAA
jgi:ABC-2 type transport system ATP-binding protein